MKSAMKWTEPAQLSLTLFFDRGAASLCSSFNNQGTGEGHELLNTRQTKTMASPGGKSRINSQRRLIRQDLQPVSL